MKIKEDLKLEDLVQFGFSKNDDDFKHNNNLDEINPLWWATYIYNIGHSRRGQFYYIIVQENRNVFLYASKPDGDGGFVPLTEKEIYLLNQIT